MKNKKGFTLIELLAIIVILAIIAVITVPIILNIIDNSKKGAVMDSALGYKDAVQKHYVSRLIDNQNEEVVSGYKLVSALSGDFSVSGEQPTSDSWVQLEKGQVVAYSLKFGDYVVTKYKETDAVVEKGNVQENEETRAMRLVMEAANAYVKAALEANSSLGSENALLVSEISGITTNVPDSGWIHFDVASNVVSVVDYSLTYGSYSLNYSELNNGDYISTFGSERRKPAVIGSQVCYGEEENQECFKLIKKYTDSETGVEMAMLFANYNLKKYTDNTTNIDTYKQETSSPSAMFFSSSFYWDNNGLRSDYAKDVNGNTASYSGNPYPYVYNVQGSDTNHVKPYVDGYLETLRTETYGLPSIALGRLLSQEEAKSLTFDIRNNEKSYWLGSSSGNESVWCVKANGNIYSVGVGSIYAGVRPVIIIPVADL